MRNRSWTKTSAALAACAGLTLAIAPVAGAAVTSAQSASGAGAHGATVAQSRSQVGERRLSLGMRGSDVRTWQRQVNEAILLGRLDHARLTPDGVFGPRTRSATFAMQAAMRVTADGIVGPVTREATVVFLAD